MLGVKPWDGLASHAGGTKNNPSHFMLQKPEICNSLMGHLASMQTLPAYAYMNSSLFSRLRFTLNIRSIRGIANGYAYNIFLTM